jgi:hypothetical protein
MVMFGYAKDYYYTGDNTLMIRVRVPNIHGPYRKQDAKGKTIRNYVSDNDLPYYQSLLLPHLPVEGEVVALTSISESNSNLDFIVIGLTGASYSSPTTMSL